MKHRPYEDWLNSEVQLTSRENQILHDHLCDCETCFNLKSQLSRVDALLSSAQTIGPAAGFSDRWQARLARDTEQKKRQQSLFLLAASAVSAGVLLFFFIRYFWNGVEIGRWMLTRAIDLTPVALVVSDLYATFGAAYLNMPAVMTPLMAMTFFAVTGGGAILWLKLMRQLVQLQTSTV